MKTHDVPFTLRERAQLSEMQKSLDSILSGLRWSGFKTCKCCGAIGNESLRDIEYPAYFSLSSGDSWCINCVSENEDWGDELEHELTFRIAQGLQPFARAYYANCNHDLKPSRAESLFSDYWRLAQKGKARWRNPPGCLQAMEQIIIVLDSLGRFDAVNSAFKRFGGECRKGLPHQSEFNWDGEIQWYLTLEGRQIARDARKDVIES